VEHAVAQQLGQRDVEDAVDLARVGGDDGAAVDEAHERRDRELPDDGRERRQRRHDVDELAPQPDLLLGFAQRGVARVVVDAGFDLAARERDLAPVRRHGLGPAGQHQPDVAVLLEQREEHRGGPPARRERWRRGRHVVGELRAHSLERARPGPGRERGPGRRRASPGRRRPRDALAAAPGPRIAGGQSYFFLPGVTLARTSRLESTRRSSPSTVTSVPPYFE
jgi:hypothetical protein